MVEKVISDRIATQMPWHHGTQNKCHVSYELFRWWWWDYWGTIGVHLDDHTGIIWVICFGSSNRSIWAYSHFLNFNNCSYFLPKIAGSWPECATSCHSDKHESILQGPHLLIESLTEIGKQAWSVPCCYNMLFHTSADPEKTQNIPNDSCMTISNYIVNMTHHERLKKAQLLKIRSVELVACQLARSWVPSTKTATNLLCQSR